VKLAMTLVVRNEQDILRANLDYHLAQGVDHVLVTDHGSTDSTPEILADYEREGVVTVLRDDEEGHHQSRRVTRMARLTASDRPADWVIHNDADEFWWPLAGSLRDAFAAIPREFGQVVAERFNFLPLADADGDGRGEFWERLLYREVRSTNRVGRPLEPKVAHRPHPDVVVAAGNHSLSGTELRPVALPGLFEVMHFPMRSFEQWEQKVVQTGSGYAIIADRGPEVGRDQLALLAVAREDRLADEWQAALLDPETLARRLAGGELVRDTRVAEFMRRPPGAARPDGAAVQSLVALALRTPLELDLLAQRARELEAELMSAVQARRADEAALAQLRSSRLVRWSAPARRAFYRARGH
jgi:hypothetical protein